MSIVESLKNCEGCRNRKQFLKDGLRMIAAGIGLTFMLPSKTKAQLQCYCTHCRVGDICLCCDPFCDHCSITNRIRCCVQVLEFCDGVPTWTAVCCPNGTCPGISQTEGFKPTQWEVSVEGNEKILLLSTNEKLDAMDWLKRHDFHITAKNGERLHAVSAEKL